MTSHSPTPGIPVIPEATPARSKVERLMPLASTQRTASSLNVAMAYTAFLIAVVTLPGRVALFEKTELARARRPDDDAKAGIALLLALGAAPRAGHLVVARATPAKMDAQAMKIGPDINKLRH